jgi:hypothetical protein
VTRPAKTLQERVRDRSFLARRHSGLLGGPLVGPPRLREIQRRWQAETDGIVRKALEREYEKRVLGLGKLPGPQERLSSGETHAARAGGSTKAPHARLPNASAESSRRLDLLSIVRYDSKLGSRRKGFG